MMTQNADKKREQAQFLCMDDMVPQERLRRNCAASLPVWGALVTPGLIKEYGTGTKKRLTIAVMLWKETDNPLCNRPFAPGIF